MYVCMYVWKNHKKNGIMYVCMYVIMICISNLYVRNIENVYLYVLYVWMYVCKYDVCMYVCMYSMYVCMYEDMYVCMYVTLVIQQSRPQPEDSRCSNALFRRSIHTFTN